MKFPETECRACGKTVIPKTGHVSVKMFGKMASYRGVQYECPLCGEKAIWEPDERLSGSEMARCPSLNPETGSRCDMGWGHFGSHNVGGPYKKHTEEWVTKCEDEPCVYHECFVSHPGYEQCIHCGDLRRMEFRPEVVEEKIASLVRAMESGQCGPEAGQQMIDSLSLACVMEIDRESNKKENEK